MITTYTLSSDQPFDKTKMVKLFNQLDMDFDDLTAGFPMKWYDFFEDMIQLSSHFPDTTFELIGIGEECQYELWIAWFKDGQGYKEDAKVVWPIFDEGKLNG